jgi:hypothetical protein
MSVLVILGTSAAMAKSDPIPSPRHARAVIAAGVRLGDASSPASVTEVGGGNLPQADDHAGISVAMSRVRANCARTPQARGLLRALQRLANHGSPSSPGYSGHGNGHAVGSGNGHAVTGSSGKRGHPNHGNSTTTGHAGGGGKGKGAGRSDG